MTDHTQPTTGSRTLGLALTFASDWGVGTGTGVAGGVDAVVERDSDNHPMVRGSVLTGILREQAANAAHALDGGQAGAWTALAARLFGDRDHAGLLTVGSVAVAVAPRGHKTLTTRPSDRADSHEVVSLSIDPSTGTAQQDHLRLIERAGAGTGTGTLTFLDEADGGAPVTWDQHSLADARLLVSLAAALVQSIGSDRSNGDGRCTLTVTDADPAPPTPGSFRDWCRDELGKRKDASTTGVRDPHTPRVSALTAPVLPQVAGGPGTGQAAASLTVPLTLTLENPLVSYDVPMSNEVSSLDFLRGTVLLPWVHGRLRRAVPGADAVRDAVVAGHLQVSDALPAVRGTHGLPVPLVLTRPKVGNGDGHPITYSNRLRVSDPDGVHVPVREGYLFLPSRDGGSLGGGTGGGTSGALGKPALTGRQSTAIDARTGSAQAGQLYLVRAIPAGTTLQATVTVRAALLNALGNRPEERLAELLGGDALLGARRRSGTYGAVRCEVGSAATTDAPAPWDWDGEGTTTLWLTSDLLLRSRTLGTGSGVEDLLAALRTAGADLALYPTASTEESLDTTDQRFSAGLRYRRIDTWHAAARRPRPTRVAVKAGSVLRVAPASPDQREAAARALGRVARDGLGHLRAEGYGRIAVGHPFLTEETSSLRSLDQSDFITGGTDQ